MFSAISSELRLRQFHASGRCGHEAVQLLEIGKQSEKEQGDNQSLAERGINALHKMLTLVRFDLPFGCCCLGTFLVAASFLKTEQGHILATQSFLPS